MGNPALSVWASTMSTALLRAGCCFFGKTRGHACLADWLDPSSFEMDDAAVESSALLGGSSLRFSLEIARVVGFVAATCTLALEKTRHHRRQIWAACLAA